MPDTKSKIAELEKELYAKEFEPRKIGEPFRPRESTPLHTEWSVNEKEGADLVLDVMKKDSVRIQHHRLVKRFLFVSVLFFVLASATAWFVWSRGENIISGENIAIDVLHPVAVAGGEQFETSFVISNNNKVPLEEVALFVEFPSGFYSYPEKTEIQRFSKKLGTIAAGQMVTERVNALVYGEEQTKKELAIVLEYRTAGSNATLKKIVSDLITISSSPVNVTLGAPREASVGQEIEMIINVESNSQNATDGVLVEASYPPDFLFKSADPAPSYDTNKWLISSLAPREKRVIKVKGIVDGREGEAKVTKISVGTASSKDVQQVGVVYNSVTETTSITKSLFSIDLSVDGERATEYSVPFGRGVRADIFWGNNSATKITDATIEVKLKGDTLNRYSVYASSGGFYRSIDDTIVWGKTGTPALAVIDPGEQGNMSFSFSPVVAGVGASYLIKNPQITLEITARAHRAAAADGSGEITTFSTRKIKIETDVRLAARAIYFSGPFSNIGPLPPRAEKETTYTIVWTVRNASNNISDASVRTTLPIYVKWLDKVSPGGEDIRYDGNDASVTWNVGRLPAGGTREAAFQISFTPSLAQLNQSPTLIGDSFLSATDDFTKTKVGDRRSLLNTNLTTDSQFSAKQGIVVE